MLPHDVIDHIVSFMSVTEQMAIIAHKFGLKWLDTLSKLSSEPYYVADIIQERIHKDYLFYNNEWYSDYAESVYHTDKQLFLVHHYNIIQQATSMHSTVFTNCPKLFNVESIKNVRPVQYADILYLARNSPLFKQHVIMYIFARQLRYLHAHRRVYYNRSSLNSFAIADRSPAGSVQENITVYKILTIPRYRRDTMRLNRYKYLPPEPRFIEPVNGVYHDLINIPDTAYDHVAIWIQRYYDNYVNPGGYNEENIMEFKLRGYDIEYNNVKYIVLATLHRDAVYVLLPSGKRLDYWSANTRIHISPDVDGFLHKHLRFIDKPGEYNIISDDKIPLTVTADEDDLIYTRDEFNEYFEKKLADLGLL